MRLLTETKTVKIKDAEFTIGVIDRRKFHPIKVRYSQGTQCLTECTPDEIKNLPREELLKKIQASLAKLSPEERIKREDLTFGAQWDFVKYGVKAHSGYKDAEGKDIPLSKDDGGCVSDETLNSYELNHVLAPLSNEIFTFNDVSELEKKNL